MNYRSWILFFKFVLDWGSAGVGEGELLVKKGVFFFSCLLSSAENVFFSDFTRYTQTFSFRVLCFFKFRFRFFL